MSGSIVNLVSAASVLAGVVSAAGAILQARRTASREQRESESVRRAPATEAIAASDLRRLSKFLFETIGSIRIGDYVRNPTLRSQARAAFQQVSDYVGRPGQEVPTAPPPVDITSRTPSDDAIRFAERDIEEGEVWNGLARLRQQIEIELRARLPVEEGRRVGAGALVAAAQRYGLADADAVRHLRYAVQIANAGIHGEDVDIEQAYRALDSARYGLGHLTER